MALTPRLISRRGAPCAIVLADLRGARIRGLIDQARAAELSTEIDLRDGALIFDPIRFIEGESQWADRLLFNERLLAPKEVRTLEENGSTVVELVCGVSLYSAFRAAGDQLAELPDAERVAAMLRYPLGTLPVFSQSLGVCITLETADAKLITTRRGATTAGAGTLNISMSEAVNLKDASGETYDPYVSVVRGLAEELGVEESALFDVVFHTLMTNAVDGGVSILGHARTSLTSDEVQERHADAPDADESEELFVTDFSAEAIGSMLEAPEVWIPWGPPTLLGTVALRFGDETAELLERRAAVAVTA